jgi:SNF2 family DNA or RNA helicase
MSNLLNKKMARFNYLIGSANLKFNKYQYKGVEWCVKNELNSGSDIRGGFVADEMGLGKTLLMIGTMFVNMLPRTLIVVPPVLILQWSNEIYKVSGHHATMYYGHVKKNMSLDHLNKSRIVLTTYHTLLSKKCIVQNVVWDRVIFDEAHHLRNSRTQRFHICKQINAKIRWLVTGTPIQNKKKDFYDLCSIAGLSPSVYKNPDNLKNIVDTYVLRRTKLQVGIDLPPVIKTNCIVDWQNIKEMKLSEKLHSLIPKQSGVSLINKTQLAKVFGDGGVLVAMIRAKQSCIMPALMRKTFEENGLYHYLEALDYTSKLDAVIELMLERKDNGKGKIVFCHYRNEIDAIVSRLLKGGLKKVISYDGRNSGGEQLKNLAEPADALVIQIQTGCEGLNLQANFSEIYFVSPDWNPCVEDQAIARCHRIGQTNVVNVFKFEMKGFKKQSDLSDTLDPVTLETYVNKIQNIKRAICEEILNGN